MLVRLCTISGNVIHLEINSPAFLSRLEAALSVFSVSFLLYVFEGKLMKANYSVISAELNAF